jgi:prepilin-type N-terminal cleavage/methylation domain-containing protein
MRDPAADERGMTLVETMIAAAVIGVGLVAVSAALPVATHGVVEGKQLSAATFLASERLEQVRAARWEQGPPAVDALGVSASPAAPPATGSVTTFADEPAMTGPYAGYARTVRIADCAAGCGGIATAGLRQVTVTVTYRPMTGTGAVATAAAKAATLTMYVAQR